MLASNNLASNNHQEKNLKFFFPGWPFKGYDKGKKCAKEKTKQWERFPLDIRERCLEKAPL